jgi:hypothetical protein
VRRDRLDRHLPTAAKENLMRSNRIIRRLCTIATATLLVVIAAAALGCGASARTKVLTTTLVATNAARDGFRAWEVPHMKQLVDEAKTKAESDAKLAAFRVEQAKVVELFEAVYQAISIATLLKDDPTSLAKLATAAGLLMTELHTLTEGKI